MTLTLAESIDEQVRQIVVSGDVSPDIGPGYPFRLDNEALELVRFGARHFDVGDSRSLGYLDRNRWHVRRGRIGSEAAPHDAGTELEGVTDAFVAGADEDEPSPFPTDEQIGATSPITGPTVHDALVALASGDDTTPGLFAVMAVSNDTGGVGIVSFATGDDNADASTTATSVDGAAMATSTATASGSGYADASRSASGDSAYATTTVQASDAGQADATVTARNASVTDSASMAILVGAGTSSSNQGAIAVGSNNAETITTATSVDGNATATTTATASGTGSADATSTATAAGGTAHVGASAAPGGTAADISAGAVTGSQGAVLLGSGGQAQIIASDPATNLLNDQIDLGAGFGVTATSTVGNASAAPALVKLLAVNDTDQVSISVTGANAAQPSELQVNDLPLITTGTGAPGATFVSLIYVDTTGAPDSYVWDFVSGAYIQISG